ncbi:hypothetical protein ACQEVF_57065 [Nonomuraea polychroma]|uniref:hypothetical protein n=1 Tax=Nonomuraea polychroma TaxID=46176 RepID=UPI003D946295
MGCGCGNTATNTSVVYRHYLPDGNFEDHNSQQDAEQQLAEKGGSVIPVRV